MEITMSQSGTGNANMRCRMTYTAGNGSITITNLEGCRTDSYSTENHNKGNNIVYVNIGGKPHSFVPSDGAYNYIDFPAHSNWSSWGMSPISQDGLGGNVIVTITFQCSTSNIGNSVFTTTINVGYPIVKPTLSNISVSNIGDKSAYASFSVTNSGNQNPYDPYIQLSLTNFGSVLQTIYARNGTFSNLDANRTYYVRGSDANDAGRVYTNVKSFKTAFINPGAPGKPSLSYDQPEPIPRAKLTASWGAASNGSTAIAGYRVRLYKNGTKVAEVDTESSTASYTFPKTLEEYGFEPGDIAKVGIYSYCKDWQGTKFFNGDGASTAIVMSDNLTIVSDKYIWVSINGQSFNKHKMYVSINGGSFQEVRKEKFKVIK